MVVVMVMVVMVVIVVAKTTLKATVALSTVTAAAATLTEYTRTISGCFHCRLQHFMADYLTTYMHSSIYVLITMNLGHQVRNEDDWNNICHIFIMIYICLEIPMIPVFYVDIFTKFAPYMGLDVADLSTQCD